MNHLVSALLVSTLLSSPALAQQKADDHSAHHAATPATAAANSADMADGEVRKIDKDAGKLTLKHGEIKNLDMPGMTMVFQVKEPALLDKVKVGDKVKFRAEKAGSGYVVTVIEAAK
ncbi:MAG TPA: copper-binding protein [Rubrivivax sp.]|jgi:Cu(I)/Ag(I) efflux system protein CusF|nr:copper-binding protein [Rubrivivax sp.]